MKFRGLVLASLILASLVCLLASSAYAEPTTTKTDPGKRITVNAPASFQFDASEGRIASFQDGDIRLSLSRIQYPALAAWRKNQRDDYWEQIVEGARQTVPGYRHKAKSYQRVEGVPSLDLHFARAGGELVWMRLLFFRKFTIVATAATPESAQRTYKKQARAFARSLRPYSTTPR